MDFSPPNTGCVMLLGVFGGMICLQPPISNTHIQDPSEGHGTIRDTLLMNCGRLRAVAKVCLFIRQSARSQSWQAGDAASSLEVASREIPAIERRGLGALE